MSIITGLIIENKHLDKLKDIFQEFDLDHNGFIDENEFNQILLHYKSKMSAEGGHILMSQTSFDAWDLDKDGQIDYQEFLTGVIDKKKLITKENLEKVFDIFD